jgi:transposase
MWPRPCGRRPGPGLTPKRANSAPSWHGGGHWSRCGRPHRTALGRHPHGSSRTSRRISAGLTPGGAALDDDLDTTLRRSPIWREREERLRRVPGMGPVCTRTLRRDRPELGTLSRQRLAALVGVAPLHRDRGTLRGRRPIWGGRAPGRASRYLSTLVAVRDHPVLKAFDERLRAKGKAAKLALTACLRTLLPILNAMVTLHQPWHVQEVPSAYHTRPP